MHHKTSQTEYSYSTIKRHGQYSDYTIKQQTVQLLQPITFIYSLTAGVVRAPQMTSQSVSSIFLCSPLPSETWRTPGLFTPWRCLPICFSDSLSSSFLCRSGELWTQKLKSHLVRTQSLNVLPLKPGVGQYIAIHATFTARDFFLAYFYPSGPFTCIFSQTSPDFSLCWLWLTHGSCVGPQNKIGHPAGCRFLCWVPTEYK